MKPEQKCKYCQKKKFVFFVYFIVLNKWTAWAFSWMVAPSSGELGNWKKFTLQLSQNFIKNHVFFVCWSLFFLVNNYCDHDNS